MQRLLGLGCFFLGTVSDHSIPLCQVQVECYQRAMLQTQCPQCGTINLVRGKGERLSVVLRFYFKRFLTKQVLKAKE